MAKELEELRSDVFLNLGGEEDGLGQLVTNAELDLWLNQGQQRLGFYKYKSDTIQWVAGDTTVDLPTDFAQPHLLTPATSVLIDAYHYEGAKLCFYRYEGAYAAGEARLDYWAYWPTITADADSELPPVGDEAIVYYALYRFFRRLSAGRADYRRYATLVGQNGVDLAELEAVADRWYDEFRVAVNDLQVLRAPITYYGD